MLSYLLIVGIAYGIAYWASSTGLSYWRAFVGFTVAFVVAWVGGSAVAALLVSQFMLGDAAQTMLHLLGRGFLWALIGAGFGVYRARFKLKTGLAAPAFKFPSWILPVTGGVAVIGIVLAFALPALQGKSKVQIATEPKMQPDLDLSEFKDAPKAKATSVDWSQFELFTGVLDADLALFRSKGIQDARGQHNLVVMAYKGESPPKDEQKALMWFRQAADQGDAWAQYNLAAMYANGTSVPINEEQAYFWWLLSSAQNNEYAAMNRDKLEKYLTPQQKVNAQEAARNWKPK